VDQPERAEFTELFDEAKRVLRSAFPRRFDSLILFGSLARDAATPESDIDLLVLLTGPIRLWDDLERITRALYPLQLRTERMVSAFPASVESYNAQERAFYRQVDATGIRL
jgi:predicted nucleotidyltransferase